VLEVKLSVQEQKIKDGLILLCTEMNDGFVLVRAEMAKGFAEQALARAELELRLNARIQETADRLKRKIDTLYRLQVTIVLIIGLAAKVFWPQ